MQPCAVAQSLDESGVEQRYEELEKLVTDEDPVSKVNLFAYVYEHEDVLPDQRAHALTLLGEAAGSGLPVAQYDLGSMYYNGSWLEQDKETALAWYMMAAKGDFLKAQITAGDVLYELALGKKDTNLRQQYINSSIYWLLRARSNTSSSDQDGLRIDALLARSLLYQSPSNPKFWKYEKSIACKGSEEAIRNWKIDYDLVVKRAGEGDEEAKRLLTILGSKEFDICDLD